MKNRKHLAKISAILIIVAMLLSSFGMTAMAAGSTPFGMIDEVVTTNDSAFIRNHQTALERLHNAAMNYDQSVDISDLNLSTDDYQPLQGAIVGIYPELFFVSYWRCTYNPYTGKLISFVPVYLYDEDETREKLAAFYAKADEYLALVDDSMDDFTKAVILHDAIVLNNAYLIEDTETGQYSSNYTLMVEGWGRCENYTEIYAYLLAQVGIKSEIVNSDAMNHEWMKIRLNNQYYNVDITWDDPTHRYDPSNENEMGVDLPGTVYHTYFLYSDTSIPNHYGYNSINPTASDYDNYRLHDMDAQLCLVNGAFYGIADINGDSVIVRYGVDDSMTEIFNISNWFDQNVSDFWAYHWRVSAGSNSYMVGSHSNLAVADGLLYYNTPNAVYTYNIETGENKKFADNTSNYQLFGMYIADGRVYGSAAMVLYDNYGLRTYPAEVVDLGEVIYNYLLGDTTGDGDINIADATLIQYHLAEYAVLSGKYIKAADFDENGIINIQDVTAIQVHINQ